MKNFRQRKMFERSLLFPMWRDAGGSGPSYADYPMEKWLGLLEESVSLPLAMFPSACSRQDITIVGTIVESFPDPGRKNPALVFGKQLIVIV